MATRVVDVVEIVLDAEVLVAIVVSVGSDKSSTRVSRSSNDLRAAVVENKSSRKACITSPKYSMLNS